MMEIVVSNVVIGLAVIILNLIPLVTKKYKYLSLTIILSIILMYIGGLMR